MCNIWQKKSVNEMTPAEVELFFERWPQFRWVHLTGGELFMRRDLDDLVAAIQRSCRSLYLLNFPTTGWFGDKTRLAGREDAERGVGRLMMTISIDGPKALHEEMRGLPGSWDKGDRDVPPSARHQAVELSDGVGMTLMAKNAEPRRRDDRGHPPGDSRLQAIGTAPERRSRVGPLLRQRRLPGRAASRRRSCARSRTTGRRTGRRCTR